MIFMCTPHEQKYFLADEIIGLDLTFRQFIFKMCFENFLLIWTFKTADFHLFFVCFLQVLKSSPSSSEDALTSMRSSQTNLRRQYSKQPGLPTMDRFLSHLGNPGRYQIIIMVLLAANCIPVVVNHLLMTFYAVKTPHNCRVSYFKIFAVGCGTIFRLGAAVGQ